MSKNQKQGNAKDIVIFVTKEDHATPSNVSLPEPEPPVGLILSNGEINWNCPCLGGMATGPCGVSFRQAFSCFHFSEATPKGNECFEKFKEMQDCMGRYPALYAKHQGDTDEDRESGDTPHLKPETAPEPVKVEQVESKVEEPKVPSVAEEPKLKKDAEVS